MATTDKTKGLTVQATPDSESVGGYKTGYATDPNGYLLYNGEATKPGQVWDGVNESLVPIRNTLVTQYGISNDNIGWDADKQMVYVINAKGGKDYVRVNPLINNGSTSASSAYLEDAMRTIGYEPGGNGQQWNFRNPMGDKSGVNTGSSISGGLGSGGSGDTGSGYTIGDYASAYDKASDAARTNILATGNATAADYASKLNGLSSAYDASRRQNETERYKNRGILNESLANSGNYNGGIGNQNRLALETSYSNQLNNINTDQASKITELKRLIAASRQNAASEANASDSSYASQKITGLMDYEQTLKNYELQKEQAEQTAAYNNAQLAMQQQANAESQKQYADSQKQYADSQKQQAWENAYNMWVANGTITTQEQANILGLTIGTKTSDYTISLAELNAPSGS